MKIVFLRPDLVTGTEEALSEIRHMIETDGVLRIAIAYFTHEQIAKWLIERTRQGKRTLLLLNSSDLVRPLSPDDSEVVVSKAVLDIVQFASHKYPNMQIRTLGVQRKAKGGGRKLAAYQNMHHKFLVTHDQVMFGSLNWTNAALASNYECVAISTDAAIINQFSHEFNQLWNDAQEMYSGDGKIRSIMCPKCFEANGVDFDSYGPTCTYCGHNFVVR